MGGSFSSSSASTKAKKMPPAGSISQVDRAVLDLKNARDRLSRYKAKLEKDEAKIVAKAREAKAQGKTSTALQLLKIKKMKRKEVDSVEGQLLTVLQMVQTIDSKQNEAEVLKAMATGKTALQKMHEEMSVDDVLDLMDQISEQNEVENEISNILSEGTENLSLEDEAAIEAELAALAAEMEGPASVSLPEVPSTKPQTLPTAPSTKLPDPATAATEERTMVAS